MQVRVFIGRLSSENDRKKVMDGLQSMATSNEDMDMGDVEQMIADIQPRVFLMRNVHNQGAPILLHTRWAMSYLAVPMTRQQIGWMMQGQKQKLMAQMAQQNYAGQQQGYGQRGYAQQQAPLQSSWTQPHQPQGYGAPPPPPGFNNRNAGGYGAPPPPPGFNAQNAGGYGAPPPPPGFNNQNAGGYGAPPPGSTPAYGSPPATGFGAQSAGDTGAFNTQGMSNVQGSTRNDRLPGGFMQNKPPSSSAIHEYFLPSVMTSQQALAQYEQQTGQRVGSTGQVSLAYKAVLLAQTSVRYSEKKAQLYTSRDYAFHVPDLDTRSLIHWEEYQAPMVDTRQLSNDPFGEAIFQELPLGLQDEKRIKTLEKELTDFLYNTARLIIPHHAKFKLYGDPDTDMSNFQAMVYQKAREARDAEVDKLSKKYGSLMDRLEDKLRRKERELKSEKIEIKDRKQEQLLTGGEAVLSLLKGRTNYTLSRLSRASRYKKQTEVDLQESQE
ncbi:MAG: hypothetical protein Q9P01_18065 [Anaerolineae bacterium]|nr:hypothetical protein [Anaerolineae bacterium]